MRLSLSWGSGCSKEVLGCLNPLHGLGLHAKWVFFQFLYSCFHAYFGVTGQDESWFGETVTQAWY